MYAYLKFQKEEDDRIKMLEEIMAEIFWIWRYTKLNGLKEGYIWKIHKNPHQGKWELNFSRNLIYMIKGK